MFLNSPKALFRLAENGVEEADANVGVIDDPSNCISVDGNGSFQSASGEDGEAFAESFGGTGAVERLLGSVANDTAFGIEMVFPTFEGLEVVENAAVNFPGYVLVAADVVTEPERIGAGLLAGVEESVDLADLD